MYISECDLLYDRFSCRKKIFRNREKNDSYAIGKASAIVKYHFYRSDNPFAYVQESFKITCTDDGTIKDNIG